MAKIDDITIRKIKESNDIVDVIGEYLELTPKGKNYFAVCPFHNDHSPSMSISREKQIFRCFVCGATGNVITFVKDYEKVSFVEALEILAKRSGIPLNVKQRTIEDSPYKEDYEILNLALSFYKNNINSSKGALAREYLNKRNLTKEVLDYFDIGLSLTNGLSESLSKKYGKTKLIKLGLAREDLKDIYINRIMFTIRDNYGNPVGFSGRIYDDKSDDPKYINSRETEIFKKGKILYNFYRAKDFIRKKHEIIISEGFMEVIRLHTIGIDNAVALMGTSFTKEHLDIIKNTKAKVVLNLDQDDAGKTATINIGRMLLSEGINSTVIIFKDAKDADELIVNKGENAFQKSYENRVNFVDFELDYLKAGKDLSKAEDISQYINESINIINNIEDDILRELKIKNISKQFDISEDLIRNKVKKVVHKPIKKSDSPPAVKKQKLNKYDISEIRLLYLMLNNSELIRYYENNLGYLNNEKRRMLANSIISFKEKNKTFDYSDFICYTNERPELESVLKEVSAYNHQDNYTEEELDAYVKTIKQKRVQKQIDTLSEKLKNTLDVEEKKKLGDRINNMKKELLNW